MFQKRVDIQDDKSSEVNLHTRNGIELWRVGGGGSRNFRTVPYPRTNV